MRASFRFPLLLLAMVVLATPPLVSATAALNHPTLSPTHSHAHQHHHRSSAVGSAACTGPALSQLPSLPLPNYYVPSSIESNLTTGGRMSVHGWLMLPWDRPASTPASVPVSAWLYHHTPEFFTESPHDFLLLISAELTLANTSVVPTLPLPPTSLLLGTEYVFTPPQFSLDELILSSTMPAGVLSNGSFDTPQRYPLSAGKMHISSEPEMRTVHYLNQSTPCTYANPVYLSYPRAVPLQAASAAEPLHLYLLHLVYASPDYDQALHIRVDPSSCSSAVSPAVLHAMGATWTFPSLGPGVLQRAVPSPEAQPVLLMLEGGQQVKCSALVLEEIHCVTIPDSFAKCPPTTAQQQQQQQQQQQLY